MYACADRADREQEITGACVYESFYIINIRALTHGDSVDNDVDEQES